MAEQARLEKVALAELDRAATRLENATEHRRNVVTQAEAAVADAQRAHEQALAVYARCAGVERAARLLGVEERELRRLAKEIPG
jgi:hypothetical protein